MRHRRIRIALGNDVRTFSNLGAQPAAGGDEPLLSGERVVLDWPDPSARAVLALRVSTAYGEYTRVIALRWRPEHVEVTALADGALSVISAGLSGTIPAPPSPASVVWDPRSARVAAERILDAVDHFTYSQVAQRTICSALVPEIAPMFGADPAVPDDGCVVPLYWYGDENVPSIRYSRHAGLTLAVHGARAVFKTRLSHIFYRGDNLDPPRATVTARAVLARDASGVWRLRTLTPLLPLVAANYRRTFSDGLLAELYAKQRAFAHTWATHNAQRAAAERAASVVTQAAAPCGVKMTDDDRDDVNFYTQPARRPADHTDVDLAASGSSATCIALRTYGPLPASFSVNVGAVGLSVSDGRVLATTPKEEDDFDEDSTPLRGIEAYLTADQIVVKLPKKLLTHKDDIVLTDTHGYFGYSDVN